jgi:hypothetical protein
MVRRVVEVALALSWVVVGACGRIGIDAIIEARDAAIDGAGPSDTPDDAPIDAPIDGPPPRVVYVGTFVQRALSSGNPTPFTAQARAPGNAVVLQVSCAGNAVPTAVAVTASGWSFTQLGPIVASAMSPQRSATFAAIAPDTIATAVSVRWTGSNCAAGTNDLGDEFSMTDPAGGQITFDNARTVMGVGDCAGTIATMHAGDAVWAACNSDASVNAVGPGFIKAGDDAVGDWTEYKITDDPAGTMEQVVFLNDDVPFVLSMVTLKPR